MLLVLQIAAGIVLGVVILAYWRKILHVAVALLVLAAVAAFLVWAKTASEQDLNTASWIVLLVLAYGGYRLVREERLQRADPRIASSILHNTQYVLAFLMERGEKGATAEEIIQGLGHAMDSGGPKPCDASQWGKSSVHPALRVLQERGHAKLAEPISLGVWRVSAEAKRTQERFNFILTVLRERGDQGATATEIHVGATVHAVQTHGDFLWQPSEDPSPELRWLEEQKLVEHSGEHWRIVGADPRPAKPKIERIPNELPDYPIASAR